MGYSPYNAYAGSSSISDDNLYRVQSELIHNLAMKHSCVDCRTFGRLCVARLSPMCKYICPRANGGTHSTHNAPRRLHHQRESPRNCRKTNKLRANYYNFYTDKVWGDAASYHLTIDSDSMSMDNVAELVCAYVRARFPDLSVPIE